MELNGGNLRVGVYFTFDEIFTKEIPLRGGGVYSMEAEPYIPAPFEKRTEIELKKQVF